MAVLLHAVLNASGRLWSALPEYSVEPPTAAEAAQTVHINVVPTVVLWLAAVVVVLVCGPRDLSRRSRQVLVASGGVRSRPRVR